MGRRLSVAAFVPALLLAGCVTGGDLLDLWGYRALLDQKQRRYTQFMRWGELDRAAEYVDEEGRGAFLERVAAFRGWRITDYEIIRFDINEARDEARVEVVYSGFRPDRPTLEHLREVQTWRRPRLGRSWTVKSSLSLPAAVSEAPPELHYR